MSKLQGEVLTLPKMSGFVSSPSKLGGNIGAKTINVGEDGATFFPLVSDDGVISWTNDKGLPNPEPVNIMGEKGEKGDKGEQGERGLQGIQGVQGVKGDKGDTGATGPTGAIGPQGDKGETGDTGPQGPKGDKGETGEQGPAGADGAKGDKGDKGDDGYTPQKGIDYWTTEDKQEIAEEIDLSNYAKLDEPNTFNVKTSDAGQNTIFEHRLDDKSVLRFVAETDQDAWFVFFNRGVEYGRIGFLQGVGMAMTGAWQFPAIYTNNAISIGSYQPLRMSGELQSFAGKDVVINPEAGRNTFVSNGDLTVSNGSLTIGNTSITEEKLKDLLSLLE